MTQEQMQQVIELNRKLDNLEEVFKECDWWEQVIDQLNLASKDKDEHNFIVARNYLQTAIEDYLHKSENACLFFAQVVKDFSSKRKALATKAKEKLLKELETL